MATRKKKPNPLNVELLNRLRDVLGGRRVSYSVLDRINYSRDLWPRSLLEIRKGKIAQPPDLIIWPETTEEVSRVLKICNEMRVPVIPFGGGSGLLGAAQPVCGGVILDTKRMNRLQRISEKSQIAVCQTGIIGAHLEKELNRQGFTMGHFPGSFGAATLGGYLATRSAGQATTLYGKIEDIVVSLQAVLADGTVLHTRTAPRRATGPDFNHLFVGSEGTLAVLTRAHMRVHLLPEARVFSCFAFPKLGPGLEAMRKIMRCGLQPAIARLSDENEVAHTLKPLGLPEEGCLLILVFDGRRTRVDLSGQKAAEICREAGGRDLGEKPARQWYGHRFAELYRQSTIFNTEGMWSETIEVVATWSNAARLYQAVRKAIGKKATVLTTFPHAYPEGCSISFTVLATTEKENDLKLYERISKSALNATIKSGGVISHAYGVGQHKVAWLAEQNPLALTLLRGVKKRLDPNNILNPGKFALDPEGSC